MEDALKKRGVFGTAAMRAALAAGCNCGRRVDARLMPLPPHAQSACCGTAEPAAQRCSSAALSWMARAHCGGAGMPRGGTLQSRR